MTPKPTTRKKKSTGLATFSKTANARPAAPKPKPVAPDEPARRGRPKVHDDRQTLTFRLRPEQHRRVRQFALDTNKSVQDLVAAGLSRLLEEHGLEPL